MSDAVVDVATALYRWYASDGRLLYVGISNQPAHRFTSHAVIAPWWRQAARCDLEWFADRVLAEAAERHAVETERPEHNVYLQVRPDGSSATRLRVATQATNRQALLRAASSPLVTIGQAATQLGTSSRTVQRLVRSGALRSCGLKGRVSRSAVRDYLDGKTQPNNSVGPAAATAEPTGTETR